eukprot:5416873-Prymnesium_polylepis.1
MPIGPHRTPRSCWERAPGPRAGWTLSAFSARPVPKAGRQSRHRLRAPQRARTRWWLGCGRSPSTQ